MSHRVDTLRSLFGPHRFLTKAECEAIAQHVLDLARDGGETRVLIRSIWHGELRWARNRVSLGSDRRDTWVQITRRGMANVITNQIDDVSLESAVRAAERIAHRSPKWREDMPDPRPALSYPTPTIWGGATYNLESSARGELARQLIAPAEQAGMLSAGYLEVRASGIALINSEGLSLYAPHTNAQCSMTVRDQHGTGSGWAGLSSYDWAQIDAPALAARALDKCQRSEHPVAIEPGRYTVILEPQAVHDLVSPLTQKTQSLDRAYAETGEGPFAAGRDPATGLNLSKLGLKVVDERISFSHDPMDPQLGVVPFDSQGEPYRPVAWIDHGVLTTLAYGRRYALSQLQENLGYPNSGSYRMSGGDTSMDEMIRTTKRGLLVTRFSNIHVLDPTSLLSTGVTRDGLWLIENGKITKAVKNFRFTESPMFVLNSIEQLGKPVPVFSATHFPPLDLSFNWPTIVPPLKVRDFSFTSLTDAI